MVDKEILCKYCKVVKLQGFNEEENRYYEKGTNTIHTYDRCQEAKAESGAPGKFYGSTPPKGDDSSIRMNTVPKEGINMFDEVKKINDKLDKILNHLKGQGSLDET